ncbi:MULTISPECIES: hypothetical protein [unclassified Bradyrhizobium]|uniref:hypothetical protein n=1 Tax=unclassified Bradyrhizobium TaxID=2631580 RepID=UPI002916D11E|nr:MULTISPECIES: hypothetical protein [unclassified Bradyrhizobium]
MAYPNEPGSKTGGASAEAAKQVTGRARMLRSTIENLMLKGYRLTSDEIATQMRESPFAIRPRCTELVKRGVLIKTQDRRKNVSGATAHILRHRACLTEVALPAPEPKRTVRPKAPAFHQDQNALFG